MEIVKYIWVNLVIEENRLINEGKEDILYVFGFMNIYLGEDKDFRYIYIFCWKKR